jgi:hypothetical protein
VSKKSERICAQAKSGKRNLRLLLAAGLMALPGSLAATGNPGDTLLLEAGSGWQSTNPGAGGAFGAVGAGPGGVIIVGGDLAGAYRSLDRGQSWDLIG